MSVPYDSPKPVPVTAEDLDEVKFDHEVDNSTESITSQVCRIHFKLSNEKKKQYLLFDYSRYVR